MADVLVDGPPEIEPVAAPSGQVAPRQPRAHGLGELCGGDMGLFDLIRISEVAEIGFGKIFRLRSPFHPPLAIATFRRLI